MCPEILRKVCIQIHGESKSGRCGGHERNKLSMRTLADKANAGTNDWAADEAVIEERRMRLWKGIWIGIWNVNTDELGMSLCWLQWQQLLVRARGQML